MYSAPRKNMPKMPATIRIWIRFAPVTVRDRNTRNEIRGFVGRCLTQDKPAHQGQRRPPPRPSVCTEPHEYRLASTIV